MRKKLKTGKVVVDGVPYYVHGTEDELEFLKTKKRAEVEAGIIKVEKSMTVKDWGKIWYNKYRKAAKASEAKNKDYKSRLFNHIYPAIGGKQIHRVLEVELMDILNGMAKKGYGKDRISKVRQCLIQLFNAADSNGILNRNPTTYLALPEASNGQGRELTAEERKAVIEAILTIADGSIFAFMLFCGLRPGEVRNIRIEDLNFDEGWMYVRGTKTKAASRFVPLHPFMVDMIQSNIKNKAKDDYLFRNEVGNPLTGNNIVHRFNALKREINIAKGCLIYRNQVMDPWTADDLVPYCLRHTYYNDLKYSKTPFAICEEIIGHSLRSISKTYSHKRLDGIRIASSSLEEYWTNEKIIDPITGKLYTDGEYSCTEEVQESPDNIIVFRKKQSV